MARRKKNTLHKHQEYELLSRLDDLPGLTFRCRNDDAWSLTFVGGAARAITGYSPDDLLHHRPVEFLRMIHPDDRERVDAQRRTASTDGARCGYRIEYRLIDAAGHQHLVAETGQVLWNDQGHPIGIEGFILDLTRQQLMQQALTEREQHLHGISAAMPDALMMMDDTGRLVFWNTAASRIFGYDADEAIGHEVHTLLAPARYRDQSTQGLRHFARTGHGPALGATSRLEALHKDGSEFPIELTLSSIRVRERWYAIGVMRDITERKQAEISLKQSRQALRNLAGHLQTVREEERSAIAREIHDELGQMLTALKIDIARLRLRIADPDPTVLALLDSIMGSLNLMIKTTQNIVATLRPLILDELGLIPAIEWQTRQFSQHTGIQCVLKLTARDIDLSPAASTALFRILQESLNNVVRHAGASKVRIDLTQTDGWMMLAVRDNGRGIAASDVENRHSFGLMGMRERAHVFGGQVSIHGEPGKGTTVQVRILAQPSPTKACPCTES
jgi:PAS domain S-box-containing protein